VYYGLAGLTVVVAFRTMLFASVTNFLLTGLWPFAGAVFMFWIPGEFAATNTSNAVVIWVGLGGLGIGVIPLVIYWPMGSALLEAAADARSVLPHDAGVEAG
jgi:hypothetical protein